MLVAGCPTEACVATAAGKVSVTGGKRFRLKRAKARVPKGGSATLRPALSSSALRAIRRALDGGRKVGAKVTVTGRGAAGAKATKSSAIRLRR